MLSNRVSHKFLFQKLTQLSYYSQVSIKRASSLKSSNYCYRPVDPGCAGCAMAHPDFGRSVNPISTRGTDYPHLITTGTPGFSDLPTALIIKVDAHLWRQGHHQELPITQAG